MEERKRQVAYKVWIVDLLNSEYVKTMGEWDPNYLKVRDLQVSRVNVVATVIGKIPGEGFTVMDIDDSSGSVSLRAWNDEVKLFQGVEVGDFVTVVGRVRDYNGKIYIVPEIVRKVDPSWLKLRKIELEKAYGAQVAVAASSAVQSSSSSEVVNEPLVSEELISEEVVGEEVVSNVAPEEAVSEEVVGSSDSRSEMLSLISSGDDGVDVSELQSKIENADTVLEGLINDGEVFKVGERVRIMG